MDSRLATGIPGFDEILGGGLLRNRVYLIGGNPGTGKTVLSTQLAFKCAARGERVAIVSFINESQTFLISNLERMAFFDPKLVGTTIQFSNGADALEEGGLAGLSKHLMGVIRATHARLLIIDALSTVQTFAEGSHELTRFLRQLGTFAALLGCTVVGTTQSTAEVSDLSLMADGLVELSREWSQLRSARRLEVLKLRGSANLEGKHTFTITSEGLHIWPRIEARVQATRPTRTERPRLHAFGIPGLDEMLRGGICSGASTALLGAPGTGKTLIGLHLLVDGARRQERGIYFGLYETPDRTVAKAEGISLPLQSQVNCGAIELVWQPPLEESLDALAEKLLAAVRRGGARRVFIDGIDGFVLSAMYPERIPRFFAALINELRAMDVTTLVSQELPLAGSPSTPLPVHPSALFENILSLQFREVGAYLHRLLAILKVREREYDSSMHEFRISSEGISVANSPESARKVLARRRRS